MADEIKPTLTAPLDIKDTKTVDTPVPDAAKATAEQKSTVENTKPDETKTTEKPAEKKPAEELKTLLDEAGEEEVKLDKDGKPIVSKVPEKYELKLPEGFTLDSEKMKIVEPLFKELELSNEQAQKLVDYQLKAQQAEVKRAEDAHVQAWETYLEGQKQEAKTYFGVKLPEVMRNVARARDTFISKTMQEKLNVAGFSNDKDFLETLDKIGRVIGEGKFVEGKRSAPGKGVAGVETEQALDSIGLDKVYPSMSKK